MLPDLLLNTLELTLDAAPWLLVGLVAAGLIKAYVPTDTMGRWLGGTGPWPVFKGALIGAPLPLCSCSVLPAAFAVRRAGASRGATVSFLVATPETGVDSVAISYALLGPFLTVVRPLAAIASAVVAGLLAARLPEAPAPLPVVEAPASSCCCSGTCAPPPPAAPRWVAGLRYAFTDLVDDLAPWLAVGLLAAGALVTFLPPNALAEWGQGPLAFLAMLLIGIPMYICATASTPVAAGLLAAGVSPGAVLVFLLAGPATNVATLALVRRELGGAVLTAYLAGISVTALAAGWLTDLAATKLGIGFAAGSGAAAEAVPGWAAALSAAFLLLIAVRPLRRWLPGLATA